MTSRTSSNIFSSFYFYFVSGKKLETFEFCQTYVLTFFQLERSVELKQSSQVFIEHNRTSQNHRVRLVLGLHNVERS